MESAPLLSRLLHHSDPLASSTHLISNKQCLCETSEVVMYKYSVVSRRLWRQLEQQLWVRGIHNLHTQAGGFVTEYQLDNTKTKTCSGFKQDKGGVARGECGVAMHVCMVHGSKNGLAWVA